MSVHIALIGRTKEPVLIGYHEYGGISKLHLLHSPNSKDFKFEELATEVKESLSSAGFDGVQLHQINAFEMHNIIETILKISDIAKNKEILVNITGGTNLMAAAGCTAAFIIGAKAYYVMDTRKERPPEEGPIVELPIPSIPITKSLKSTQISIMKKILELGGTTSNTTLRDELDLTPQSMSYHIKELVRKGLITSSRGWTTTVKRGSQSYERTDTRVLTIELTNAGRLVLNISR